jgi:hypothetical protein
MAGKLKYRVCPHCNQYIPYPYILADHKKMCNNVSDIVRIKSKRYEIN